MDNIPLIETKLKNEYKIIKKLGIGSFGVVYKAVKNEAESDGSEYAIKVIAKDADDSKWQKRYREIKYQMNELDHPNIVKYLECWMENFNMLPDKVQLPVTGFFDGEGTWSSDDMVPNIPVYCVCIKMKAYSCE